MNWTGRRSRLPAAALALVIVFSLVVVVIAGPAQPARAAAPATGIHATPLIIEGHRYTVEIRPQLELLAGVLLVIGRHEPWERLPRDGGTAYYRDLKAFFEPFKDHEAMRLANELYDGGMHTDRFATFAMHLGSLPDLPLDYAYSPDFFDEDDGDELESLRLALEDLAAQSDFAGFLVKWQLGYQDWLRSVAGRFDGDRVVNWLEGFFGDRRAEYHLILAPGIPYGCGLGPWLYGPDGTVTFDIVQDSSYSSADPSFGSKFDLEALAAHEWGHSYVNPVVADNSPGLQAFGRFYETVQSSLEEIGYDSLHAYTDEQVLRAAVCVAIEDLYGAERAEAEIEHETDQGFRLTRVLTGMFKTYRGDRDRYPEFRSYAPSMFSSIAKQPDPEGKQQFAAALLVVCLLVYGLVRLANLGRAPRAARPQAQPAQLSLVAAPTAAVAVDVVIRPPTPADEEAFVHLSRGLTLFNYPHRPPTYDLASAMTARVARATEVFRDADDKKSILLAERDGVAVGYVLVWLHTEGGPLAGIIDELFVNEDARGTGIGRALLSAADAWLQQRGVRRLRLNVSAWNADARRFYERAGYTARTLMYQRDID